MRKCLLQVNVRASDVNVPQSVTHHQKLTKKKIRVPSLVLTILHRVAIRKAIYAY
jgi:hypothetical protein